MHNLSSDYNGWSQKDLEFFLIYYTEKEEERIKEKKKKIEKQKEKEGLGLLEQVINLKETQEEEEKIKENSKVIKGVLKKINKENFMHRIRENEEESSAYPVSISSISEKKNLIVIRNENKKKTNYLGFKKNFNESEESEDSKDIFKKNIDEQRIFFLNKIKEINEITKKKNRKNK